MHPDSWLEIVDEEFPRGPYRVAIFDFDGTLSLLRRNWQDTMIPLMVDILRNETATRESEQELQSCVEEFVMRLNGKQTIYQMIQLAEEISRRGGVPRDVLDYKRQYHEQLWSDVSQRIESVRSGEVSASEMTVAGSAELLKTLVTRGWDLYLASGTDAVYVRDELELLGLSEYFGGRVYGAVDDYRNFSKAMVIQRILDECGVAGRELVAFGDGFVEIEEVRKVGGLAIGVASNEELGHGIHPEKRKRLIDAGAQWIIGDYRAHAALVDQLMK